MTPEIGLDSMRAASKSAGFEQTTAKFGTKRIGLGIRIGSKKRCSNGRAIRAPRCLRPPIRKRSEFVEGTDSLGGEENNRRRG